MTPKIFSCITNNKFYTLKRLAFILLLCFTFTSYAFCQSAEGLKVLQQAKEGDAKSQSLIGVFYGMGIEGFPKNQTQSLHWFLKAAGQNYAEAEACIGDYYKDGGPLKKDVQKAIYWYKRAVDHGDKDCIETLRELGVDYDGTKKDNPQKSSSSSTSNRATTYSSSSTRSSSSSSSTRSSSSSTRSSSSSSARSSSSSSGLLYKGMYTISGQGRSQTTGQWTSDIGDRTEEIEIYNDHIQVGGLYCKFLRESNGRRKYEGLSFGGTAQYYYVNMSNFSMSLESVFSSQFGTDFFWYAMTKGESTMPKYSNSGYATGGSGYSGGNQSSGSRTGTTTSTYHSCPTCHGLGRVERFTYPSLYGSKDYKVRCNECGKWFMRSLGHTHVTCPTCHGKGGSNY